MERTKYSYNILVIDDDPLVLEDASLMYKDMIFLGDFNDIFGVKAVGSVSTAKNTKDAESVLQANFEKDPKLVQLLHVDERMPEERGSEFVDLMRRIYTLQNIGALLVTGYATDVSVLNSREKGVYRYVSKPVTPALIKPHLKDLVEMIRLKDKPVKRPLNEVFIFKEIKTYDQLVEYHHKRFKIWRKLNYIPPEFLSETCELEVDEYDKFSIPLGGFALNDREELAVCVRIITTSRNKQYSETMAKVLRDNGDEILSNGFSKNPDHPFPVLRDCNRDGIISAFLRKYGGIQNAVEYSRIMCTSDDFRGFYLSTKICQFLFSFSRYLLHKKIGLAACLVRHVDHNIKRNGFSGTIPGLGLIYGKSVEQIGMTMFADMANLVNAPPEFHKSTVNNIYKMFKRTGFFCYCNHSDCTKDGFKLYDSHECPRKTIGYD
ncbi:MAG: hypothetical protein U5R49_16295 [Deltaproteobacteria bacterium]|nr:hypothetical protein [Deltaproteobacteria bacterium]